MKSNQWPTIKRIPIFGRNRTVNKTVKQVQPGSEKTKLSFSWVSASSLGITVFTAVLFGAGKAYRQAYLSVFGFIDAFGVNDAAIPWSFQDLVYLGITKQLSILLLIPPIAMIVILMLACLIVAMALVKNYVAAQHRKTAAEAINKSVIGRKANDDTFLELMLNLVHYVGAVFLFVLLAYFFVLGAERLGKMDAKNALGTIKASNATNLAKSQLSYAIIERIVEKRQVTEEGYVVTCSDRACALFIPNKERDAARLVALDHLVSFKYVR